MPIVPDQPRMETQRIACRMELGIAADVRAYAEWRSWDRDWAINRLLEYALNSERDFHHWLKVQKKRRGVSESILADGASGEQS
jgi:hypothetical protein